MLRSFLLRMTSLDPPTALPRRFFCYPHFTAEKLKPKTLETLARDQERPCTGISTYVTGPWGAEGAHSLFLCSPQGPGRSARPGPSYLEMPAKAQMFSVRLPSLSTRHAGPPGPWGHASHAAGTMETTHKSEGETGSS